MAIARTAKLFLGTDEVTGVTITTGNSSTSSEVDMLGDGLSAGYANFYIAKISGTGTTASGLKVEIAPRRISGGNTYINQLPSTNIITKTPVSGAEFIFLGTFLIGRYAVVKVTNTSGADMAVSVFAEVLDFS